MQNSLGTIKNAHGQRLDHTLHPGSDDCNEVAVIGHGVTGNKDRPLVTHLAEQLAAAGIPTLRFSFSGNGDSEGSFEDSCITKEVEDLGAILDALEGRRIIYLGHSMGAAVGVLRSTQDQRIQRLVSLAGMVHTAEFAKREFGASIPGSGLMWDNPECPLSSTYMNDMDTIGSVLKQADSITIPWLLVHGTSDDVVPLQDTLDIANGKTTSCKVCQIENADHVFEGKATAEMSQQVLRWLNQAE